MCFCLFFLFFENKKSTRKIIEQESPHLDRDHRRVMASGECRKLTERQQDAVITIGHQLALESLKSCWAGTITRGNARSSTGNWAARAHRWDTGEILIQVKALGFDARKESHSYLPMEFNRREVRVGFSRGDSQHVSPWLPKYGTALGRIGVCNFTTDELPLNCACNKGGNRYIRHGGDGQEHLAKRNRNKRFDGWPGTTERKERKNFF